MKHEVRALAFLREHGRAVDAAWASAVIGAGPIEDAMRELTRYQNPDGGFGNALEPDISAPQSQPFAVRLALHMVLSLGLSRETPLVMELERWLDERQDEDGCWRFPPQVKEFPLAPWFATWTFPSLNPALCLAGAATRAGIGSDRVLARVRTLFATMASVDQIPGGQFYDVLPFVEYIPWVDVPDQDVYLDALATEIVRTSEMGGYPDAGHFFDHAGPADGPIARRLPADLVPLQLYRLAGAQTEDGSWPSSYADHWRSLSTAAAIVTLRDFGYR